MTAAKSLHSPVSPANPPKGFKSLSCIINITQDVQFLSFTLFIDTWFTFTVHVTTSIHPNGYFGFTILPKFETMV